MLASQIIDNGFHDSKNMVGSIPDFSSPHSLVGVTKRYLNKDMKTKDTKKALRSSFIGMRGDEELTEEQLEYAAEDVENLYDIYLEQQKWIKERKLENIVKLENKLTPVLVKIASFNYLWIKK